MVAAVVYAVIGDTLFIGMVWISGTSLAELVMLRAVGRVNLVTIIPSTSVQLLVLCIAADTFLEKNYVQSMICCFFYSFIPFLYTYQPTPLPNNGLMRHGVNGEIVAY